MWSRAIPAPAAALAALVALVVLVAAGAALLAPSPVRADPDTDLHAEQERIEREVAQAGATLENATEQAREAAAEYAAADAALPAAERRVDETRGVVIAAEVRANTAEREEREAEQELTAATGRYDESVEDVEHARAGVTRFAAAAYQGSGLESVNVILDAGGPAEAVERLGYLSQVGSTKQEAVDGFVAARLAARQAANEATLAHRAAEEARQATAIALAQAEAAQAKAEAAASEAEALVQTRAEALAVAEEEKEESLRRYEQAEAAATRIEAELQEWEVAQQAPPDPPPDPPRSGAGSDSGSSSGALLRTPADGWMSSPFGMRYDPFFGVSQLHAGIDIAAPGGAPIVAAAEGTVIRAGWYGGYGNFTCLGHGTHQGQGLSTCYGHQSEILVGAGQWVGRGELIGRVGTTGASTGDHLHFEVRLDGSPTDPVPYLPR